MIVKAQNGMPYDIYTISTKGNNVYCRDNTDRRRKRLLGQYDSIKRATVVFDEINFSTGETNFTFENDLCSYRVIRYPNECKS